MSIENVKEYLGYAIGFIVLVLVLMMIGGDKFSSGFLALVIMGMLVLNSNTIIKFLQNNF